MLGCICRDHDKLLQKVVKLTTNLCTTSLPTECFECYSVSFAVWQRLTCHVLYQEVMPLPSARQHPSYGDCLEVKREYYQNSSVLDCVTQCSQHTYVSSSYRSNRLGLSHWDPYAVPRGCCLELYYCNMVEWFWCDSSLILTTNWFPSVLWHCWFGHLACKNRPRNDLSCVERDVKPLHYYCYLRLWLFVFCDVYSSLLMLPVYRIRQCKASVLHWRIT